MSRNLENENPETKKSGKEKSEKEKIRKKINPEKKKSGKEKFGKEIKHLDTFFSLSVSIDRGQRHSYPYVLSPVFMLSLITMCCSLPWFFCVHYVLSALSPFFFCIKVIFRQQSLKLKAGAQKKTVLKTLAMQKQIDN